MRVKVKMEFVIDGMSEAEIADVTGTIHSETQEFFDELAKDEERPVYARMVVETFPDGGGKRIDRWVGNAGEVPQ